MQDAYRRWGKRSLDLLAGGALVIVLAPLLGLIALAVLGVMGRPVLYTERRAGRYGTPFELKKFRTMTDARDANGHLLPDAERLTSLGRALRRTSLDELPELFHVLSGEMSLVGPRPLPVRYLPRFSAEQARRLEARPGLTGPAQVHGRNSLSWDEKFAHDVWYVDHVTLRTDLTLLVATVSVVIRGTGVSQAGHATMEEFWGR